MLNQELIKQEYHNPQDSVYANTSSCGLVAKGGVDKMYQFMLQLHKSGSRRSEEFLFEELPRVRETLAKFVDADLIELALIPNFSFGLNALMGVLWPYKKVLLLEKDYPSLTQPFVLNNFDITWVASDDNFSFDLDKIENAIRQNDVRIVAVSHVQYLSGYCSDIEALGKICQANGAILLVDGTQSLGAIPYSFKKSAVDIYISSNYKWMNAGFGTGIMMMKTAFLDKNEPKIGGFASFLNKDGSWGYAPSILSYEPGHLNMGGFLLMEHAIDFKLKLGLKNIYEHNKWLMDLLISGLASIGIAIRGPISNESRSSILCFDETPEIIRSLNDHQIVFKAREGYVRLGIHFHNTKEDIESIIEAVQKAQKMH